MNLAREVESVKKNMLWIYAFRSSPCFTADDFYFGLIAIQSTTTGRFQWDAILKLDQLNTLLGWF
jgi:hypothetical protein